MNSIANTHTASWWHWVSYGHGLASNLYRLRHMRGLSQARLASLAGLSRNVVSNLERNESGSNSADPVLSTVYKLAQALHVPPAALLPEADQLVNGMCDRVRPRVHSRWPVHANDTAPFSDYYVLNGSREQYPTFAG